MTTKIFDLAYEIDGDDVNLEQDMGCGEVHRVTLHRIHLRMLAEKAGLLVPASNIEADWIIARLSRQLRLLADRIDRLDTMMLGIAEKGRECVDEECAYSAASCELASEFVDDLPPPLAAPVTSPRCRGDVTLPSRVTAGTATGDKTNAERQRRYRERKRNGQSVTSITEATRNASAEPRAKELA